MSFISPLGFLYNDANTPEPWDSTEITHFNQIETTVLAGTIDGKKRSDSSGAYHSFLAYDAAPAGYNDLGDVNIVKSVWTDTVGNVIIDTTSGGGNILLHPMDSNDSYHEIIVSGDSNNKVIVTSTTGTDTLSLQASSIELIASSGSVNVMGPTFTYNGGSVLTSAGGSQDWGTGANIQGLTTTSACTVTYKDIGNNVHLWYYIYGAGSGTGLSFTLPVSAGSTDEKYFPAAVCINDATYVSGGLSINGGGGNTALAYWIQPPSNAYYTWTNSARVRSVQGYICYPHD